MYQYKHHLLFFLLIYLEWKVKECASVFCGLQKTGHSKCEVRLDEHNKTDKILCKGDFKTFYDNKIVTNRMRLNALTLCQLPGPGFDPRIISVFQQLHRFSLIKSNITFLTHDFPTIKHLQILNMTRLKLEKISVSAFESLTELKILDLSFNRLRQFAKYTVEFLRNLQHLYLRGNNWKCDLEFKWLLDKKNGSLGSKVVDAGEMECGNGTYQGKPVLRVVRFIKTLYAECPNSDGGRCLCSLDLVVWSPTGKYYVPVITVDCSYRGMKFLPETVPQNTTTLKLVGNKISDLSPLASKACYRDVSDIYLDDNLIQSADVLEGADWLSKFRVLSLRSNKIKTLPNYAFDHAFEKNQQIAKVFFGNNPWICDCHFTPGFKELLLKYSVLINDTNDIRCAHNEYDSNSMKMIRDLSLSSICREPRTLLMSPVDCINIVFSLLIVFVIVKLIYDYWIYKTTGNLPWIATKLP